MKRLVIFAILLIFSISFVYADVEIQRNSLEQIDINQIYEVEIEIYLKGEEKIDFSEMIPNGWRIREWDIEGTDNYNFEKETRSFMGDTREIYLWTFRNLETEKIILTYDIIPEQRGNFEIKSLWVTPNNFETSTENIFVSEEIFEEEEIEKEREFNILWILLPAILIGGLVIFFVYFYFFKSSRKVYNEKNSKNYQIEW